ncbi:MAG TPA: hypothetical protein VKY51_01490 [Fredinandcohnia sp.]|nr:hypothetical protein [Fredinandcohnia sp.]
MQTLVSTRILSGTSLEPRFLRQLRDRGFVALELYATPDTFDLRFTARARSFRRQLEAAGMRVPWVYLGEAYLPRLGSMLRFEELTATLVALHAEALVLPRAAWDAAGLPTALDSLRTYVQRAGARLILDAHAPEDRPVVEAPDLGFCWDVAPCVHGPEIGEEALARLPRWRLQGVRVAHLRDGHHRDPPGEEEASLLEDLWPRLAPRTLVYDVEAPGGLAALGHALDEIRAFHLGERRPSGRRGGGIFWASMAPG